jgi:hypothetical protein
MQKRAQKGLAFCSQKYHRELGTLDYFPAAARAWIGSLLKSRI